VLVHVLDRVLRLLHPVMPFLTEELWQTLPHRGETIATAPWPEGEADLADPEAEGAIDLVMEVVTRVRHLRAALNLDPGRRLRLLWHAADGRAAGILEAHQAVISTLARLEGMERTAAPDGHGPAVRAVATGVDLAIPLAGVLDLDAERRRLGRDIEKCRREIEAHDRKLSNADFLGRARPEAIDKARRAQRELQERIDRLERTLDSLR
jgi:valyl-tRNA synthetase